MSETIEESYNKLVDSINALEQAIREICDIGTQLKILKRKEELHPWICKEGAKAKGKR